MLAKMLEKSRIILMHRIMDGCFSKLSCFLVCTPIIRLFGAWERCARMVSPSCHPYLGWAVVVDAVHFDRPRIASTASTFGQLCSNSIRFNAQCGKVGEVF